MKAKQGGSARIRKNNNVRLNSLLLLFHTPITTSHCPSAPTRNTFKLHILSSLFVLRCGCTRCAKKKIVARQTFITVATREIGGEHVSCSARARAI
jgi:hypothetical protein